MYELLKQPKPPSSSMISETLGISIRTYRRWFRALKDGNMNIITPPKSMGVKPLNNSSMEELSTFNKFSIIPVIQKYNNYCFANKMDSGISHLFRICNLVNIHPDQLVTGEALNESKKTFIIFEERFRDMFPDITTTERYRKALRRFVKSNNVIIPERDKVLYGGTDSKPVYTRVFLKLNEVKDVAKIINEKCGLNYMYYFILHHEIFARPHTLHGWIPNFHFKSVDVDKKQFEFAECSIFENKQNKQYDKIMLDPIAIKVAKMVNGKKIINEEYKEFERVMSRSLREAYEQIGKIHKGTKYNVGHDGWMWQNKPLYSIRHSATVHWLYRTGFDAMLVSKMGWEKADTLMTHYARIDVANIMQKGVCYYCRPPMTSTDLPLFCSAPHALAYMNGART